MDLDVPCSLIPRPAAPQERSLSAALPAFGAFGRLRRDLSTCSGLPMHNGMLGWAWMAENRMRWKDVGREQDGKIIEDIVEYDILRVFVDGWTMGWMWKNWWKWVTVSHVMDSRFCPRSGSNGNPFQALRISSTEPCKRSTREGNPVAGSLALTN